MNVRALRQLSFILTRHLVSHGRVHVSVLQWLPALRAHDGNSLIHDDRPSFFPALVCCLLPPPQFDMIALHHGGLN